MSFQMYCSFTTNVRIKLLRIMTHNWLTVDYVPESSQFPANRSSPSFCYREI